MTIGWMHRRFYTGLEGESSRDFVRAVLAWPPGEQVLMKGVVSAHVDDRDLAASHAFLDEIGVKASRYIEAVSYPGAGTETRVFGSKPLGGLTRCGGEHRDGTCNP